MVDVVKRKPGNPKRGNTRLCVVVSKDTAKKLKQVAKVYGIVKQRASKSFYGSIVVKLLEIAEVKDPEYLQLAKTAKLVQS